MKPYLLIFGLLSLVFSSAWANSLPSLTKEAPSGLLLLEHVNTDERLAIPQGAKVRVKLDGGGVFSGVIEGFAENAIIVQGTKVPLSSIKSLYYPRAQNKGWRVLGVIGYILSAISVIIALGLTISLVGFTGLTGIAALFAGILYFGVIMIYPVGLFLLSRLPFNRDRFNLKKWYKASVQQVSGE